MKFKLLVAGILMLSLLIFSCGNSSSEKEAIISPQESKNENQLIAENENYSSDTSFPRPTINNGQQKPVQSSPDWDKKIIKTAVLNLEVKDYPAFSGSMREKIRKHGGYVSQETQNQSDYRIENVVMIKVPVHEFDNLLKDLTAGQEKIQEKRVSSEDVSMTIVDTKSRLAAKKQARLKYLEFLGNSRNIEEMLNVQREINSIQEEIEAASGRIAYLSHASAYSTVNLTYFQILDAGAKTNEPGFGSNVLQAFRNGWDWIGEVLIGLVSVWPLFLIAFLCWMGYRRWRSAKQIKGLT